MTDFLTALALVLVIEGITYALAPGLIRAALQRMETLPESTLRIGGLAAAALGVVFVWLLRGGQ